MSVRPIAIILCLPFALAASGCGPTREARGPITAGAPKPVKTASLRKLDVNTLERIAQRTAKAGKHQQAAVFYSNALKGEPNRLSLKLGLANSLMALGGYHGAVRIYRELLAHDPENPSIRQNLGRALIGVNKPKEGIWYLEELITKAPKAELLDDAGIAHHLLGNFRQAQSYFRRAQRMEPGNRITLNNLAVSLALSGSATEGGRILNSLARQQQSPKIIRLNLAYVTAMASGQPAKNKRLIFLTKVSPSGSIPLAARFPPGATDPQFLASPRTQPVRADSGSNAGRGRNKRGQTIIRSAGSARRDSMAIEPMPPQTQTAPAASGLGGIATSYATINRAATPAIQERGRALGARKAVPERKKTHIARSGGGGGRYVIQLGAFEDRGNAKAAMVQMALKAPRIVKDNPLMVESNQTRDMGLLFRVRTSDPMDRPAADGLCSALKARSLRCFVGTVR